MAAVDYEPFVDRMIHLYEGGYGWDANDPGGPTKYGITCYNLAAYYGQRMTSMSAWAPRVKAMTLDTAEIIYAQKYAAPCSFNLLNRGSDCVIFDFGVNSGPPRAIKFAQQIVGTTVDGILRPITLAAINNYDTTQFINELCANRMAFLRSLRNWNTFKHGWTNRITDLKKYSVALTHPAKKSLAVPEDEYVEKLALIPMAFAKGYDEPAEMALPMAVHSDVSIGTNAAIPVAIAGAREMVPQMFWGYITYDKVAPMVGSIVKTALDAVNEAHKTPPPPTEEQLK